MTPLSKWPGASRVPVDKEFSVYVKAQPEEAGLNSMLNIFFGGLTFGAAPGAAGGLGSAIDIAKGFQYDMGEYVFNLTDWQKEGYRATGQDGPTSYSGVICSLDKPFTVVGHNGPLTYTNTFTPVGDGRTGTATLVAGYGGVSWKGGGSYKVEGFDGDKPRILFEVSTTASAPGAGSSGSGTAHIDLVPLDTDECN